LNSFDVNADNLNESAEEVLDLHVVILINYLRVHHVLALREFSRKVRKLTILLSVPMEPDRDWEAQWEGLDVRVQRNFMWTANWRHSTGFSESNFIHFPIDTPWRLRELKPDLILSYEMGARTMLSMIYKTFKRKVPVVMIGNMSEHIESERGILRRMVRKLLSRGVNYFTYNGPSCKRYLRSLGVQEDRLFHFPYCINEATVFKDETKKGNLDQPPEIAKLLYCGSISQRKGIVQFSDALAQWCENNTHQKVELMIAGSGDLKADVAERASHNLHVKFLGNCDVDQLREAYGVADICVFPTLADEWGLVPIEAMASGVPVLGSIFAQSVEACCVDSENSWIFDPTDHEDIMDAIDRALSTTESRIREMGIAAKKAVAHISPENSATHLHEAVEKIIASRNRATAGSIGSLKGQAI
jgi:glycosyltransferase involved in cell wall biosynthesis